MYGMASVMLLGMRAYAFDLRQKILRACDQRFGSQRAIAALFGVSQSFVATRLRRRRATGAVAPRPHAGGRGATCDEAALGLVRSWLHTHPDATLAELCAQRSPQRGLQVRVPTRSRMTRPLGLPRNKSRSGPASRTPHGSSKHGRSPGS
jgi:transposase